MSYSIKEGPVKCETVCDKCWVILKNKQENSNLTSVVEYEDKGQPRVMLKINSKAELAEEGTYFLIPQFFKLKYHQVKLEIKT